MTEFALAIRNFVGPGEVPDVQGIYAYAERAEALGFESLWAWDHILLGVEPAFPILDSITVLGAVAARTRRIKLGTGVLVLPLRNPVTAATWTPSSSASPPWATAGSPTSTRPRASAAPGRRSTPSLAKPAVTPPA